MPVMILRTLNLNRLRAKKENRLLFNSWKACLQERKLSKKFKA